MPTNGSSLTVANSKPTFSALKPTPWLATPMTLPSMSRSNAPPAPTKRKPPVISKVKMLAPVSWIAPSSRSALRMEPASEPATRTKPDSVSSMVALNWMPNVVSMAAIPVSASISATPVFVKSRKFPSAAATFIWNVRSVTTAVISDGRPSSVTSATCTESAV